MMDSRTWATDVEIIATATVLMTSIPVFYKVPGTATDESWLFYSPEIVPAKEVVSSTPIYLKNPATTLIES
jgi:hypothetical protein